MIRLRNKRGQEGLSGVAALALIVIVVVLVVIFIITYNRFFKQAEEIQSGVPTPLLSRAKICESLVIGESLGDFCTNFNTQYEGNFYSCNYRLIKTELEIKGIEIPDCNPFAVDIELKKRKKCESITNLNKRNKTEVDGVSCSVILGGGTGTVGQNNTNEIFDWGVTLHPAANDVGVGDYSVVVSAANEQEARTKALQENPGTVIVAITNLG